MRTKRSEGHSDDVKPAASPTLAPLVVQAKHVRRQLCDKARLMQPTDSLPPSSTSETCTERAKPLSVNPQLLLLKAHFFS